VEATDDTSERFVVEPPVLSNANGSFDVVVTRNAAVDLPRLSSHYFRPPPDTKTILQTSQIPKVAQKQSHDRLMSISSNAYRIEDYAYTHLPLLWSPYLWLLRNRTPMPTSAHTPRLSRSATLNEPSLPPNTPFTKTDSNLNTPPQRIVRPRRGAPTGIRQLERTRVQAPVSMRCLTQRRHG
jgi:hypothetical protein